MNSIAPDADEVTQRALEIVMARDGQEISADGHKSYGGNWAQSVERLNAAGLNSGQFVGTVVEVAGHRDAHKVMHAIAQDPTLAASFAGMSPARKVAAITKVYDRMSEQSNAATPPAAQISAEPVRNAFSTTPPAARAAAPSKPAVDWRSDAASDEEFSRGWHDMSARRGHKFR